MGEQESFHQRRFKLANLRLIWTRAQGIDSRLHGFDHGCTFGAFKRKARCTPRWSEARGLVEAPLATPNVAPAPLALHRPASIVEHAEARVGPR